MLVRFLMSLLLLCTEERKTFATCWFAVGSLRLMTQEPDLAGDLGVKLVRMCHNLVKSTRLVVFLYIYIGETGRNLATRFSEHLRNVQNGVHKPVSLHFRSSGHQGCTDMEVLGLRSSRGGAKSRFDSAATTKTAALVVAVIVVLAVAVVVSVVVIVIAVVVIVVVVIVVIVE
ncbi:hypothetical protein ElyMa_002859100 [Elysia marginata]|uniref:GIY-YIG domain-containing protein n=1 Tax=Elysia marginata TaxID=1093978 RepID=A0AAV4HW99_9GAST|nr:hypothetical protein ElyMa_002859100 [Elysia marginata]